MDPDACYAELKQVLPQDTREAELFTALDEWLSKGGFLPKEWEKAKVAHWQGVLVSTNAKAASAALDAAREGLEALLHDDPCECDRCCAIRQATVVIFSLRKDADGKGRKT